ncbi:MAG: hypothetical protein HYZ81_24725, partial [Nitrospinae bacterium]|nr:hypothetical protein [Nitrospinota bacterium]
MITLIVPGLWNGRHEKVARAGVVRPLYGRMDWRAGRVVNWGHWGEGGQGRAGVLPLASLSQAISLCWNFRNWRSAFASPVHICYIPSMHEVTFTPSAFRHGFNEADFYELLTGRYLKIRSQQGLPYVYELLGRNLAGDYLHVVYRMR